MAGIATLVFGLFMFSFQDVIIKAFSDQYSVLQIVFIRCSVAPVSVVAPFEYTYIIWAVLFGFLIWSEVPAATTFIGLGLLIGSSLYILRRELQARNIQSTENEVVPGTVAIQPK